ncbi:hypothetical protein GUJ93_ZPchr0007g3936 [Zizania palustris]|uniref:Uncharacterized protein n=1 Tax=Zizania palustris TaxID=103762 RepID=A0A8J5TA00_ZIZPA|nr:hypothetical protein GUJ93_ZPchr0007g3936 [Zizania palustris]
MTMESVSDLYAVAQGGGFRSETSSVSSLAPGTPTTMGIGGQSRGGRAYMVLTETPDEPPSTARFLGMISTLAITVFVAAGIGDRAMGSVLGEVIQSNPELLQEVDPSTR